eukprot:PhM_4_TR14151/c3_g2_i1/m.51605
MRSRSAEVVRRRNSPVNQDRLQELGQRRTTLMTHLRQQMNIGPGISYAKLPTETPQALAAAAEARVLQHRGESRQTNIRGSTNQFLSWVQDLPEGSEDVDTAWKLVWFTEGKVRDAVFRPSVADKFIRTVAQSLREMGFDLDEDVLGAAREAYRKEGIAPERQAPPATREQVEQAALMASATQYLGFMIAWKTASRIDELRYLTRECFREETEKVWSVTFPRSKGDPYRFGTVCVMNLTQERDHHLHQTLTTRLRQVNVTTPVSDLTTSAARTYMGAVADGLTAHSIKRGALTELLRCGVPLNIIQIVAKHKDMSTLLRYLPSTEVALHLKLQDATTFL